MGVVNLPSGKPTLRLTGGALARLQAITPAGYAAQIDLALTDEYPLAQAFVVISAMPIDPAEAVIRLIAPACASRYKSRHSGARSGFPGRWRRHI